MRRLEFDARTGAVDPSRRPEPDTVLDVAREAGWFTDIVDEIFTPGTGSLAGLWA